MRALLITSLAFSFAGCAQRTNLSPALDAYLEAQKTGICEIHHVRMERKEVAMSYGLPMYNDAWVEASRQFPHAKAYVSGGCEVPAHREKASVYVCPRCRQLERQWALRHPTNPES